MKTNYVKRSQKDYSLSLKLQIVQAIEQGELSTTGAQRQYGIQGRSTVVNWLKKQVNLFETVLAYPNPTKGLSNISLPISEKEVVIELFNIHSQLISSKVYPVNYGKVQLNLEEQPTGVYIAKVLLAIPVTLKVVKN